MKWRFWGRKRRDEELEEEIAHDLAMDAEDRVQDGMSRRDAENASRKDFGNVLLVKETTREVWAWRSLEILAQDIRYAARTLRRSPGFAATSILTLALAIGVNTAIFTVFDEVAFRPLPVKDGDRIVGVYESFHGQFDRKMHGNIHMLSYSEFLNFQAHNRVFTEVAAFAEVRRLTLAGAPPERVSGALVSEDYFRVLGAGTALGRTFTSEELSSPHAVAVLSNTYWQRRFGSDPDIVGKTIRLNQTLFTIIGVTAPGFMGTTTTTPRVWLPLSVQPQVMVDLAPPEPQNLLDAGNLGWLSVIGKLKSGVSARQAQAGLQFLASQMDVNYPGRITEVNLIPSTFLGNPDARLVVLIGGSLVMVAVGLVLFVACANVANLLLARATVRQREIAVRLSIGATRRRLIGQLLTESTLLAFLGSGIGLLLAEKALAIGRSLAGLSNVDLSPNLHVLSYTLLLSITASLMFGLVPALQATSLNLGGAMKEEGSIAGWRVRKSRLRSRLIAAQVGICCVLLVGAGLLVRGLMNLNSLDPGFHVKNVFLTSVDLRLHGYDDTRSGQFYRELLARIDSEPGVHSALAAVAPLRGIRQVRVVLDGQSATARREVNFNIISDNYFDVLGIRLSQGRTFNQSGAEAGHPVAIINEAMAKAAWPGQSAIGKRFLYGSQSEEVIGVARDVRSTHISGPDGPMFYLTSRPNSQELTVITRSEAARSLAATIRQIVHQLDPTVLASVHTMEENLDHETAPTRVASALALLLGGLSLALAAVGIYGVTAYLVTQRTHEVGVRMALGAESSGILRWMLAQSMRPVVVGVAIGLPLAAAGSIASSQLLLGVHPLDPVAFLGVTVFLSLVALLASYLPARRATRVDPMIALRYE